MKLRIPTPITSLLALALAAGIVALTLSSRAGVASVSADSERHGDLQVTMNCANYTGAAGSSCTITTSNLEEIKVGSNCFMGQPTNIPVGFLDSNVLLEAGSGDWTVGRITVEFATGRGLGIFSDGTGQFAGLNARFNVSTTDGLNFSWNGTYAFGKIFE